MLLNLPSFVTKSQAENTTTLDTVAQIVLNIKKMLLSVVKEFCLDRFLKDESIYELSKKDSVPYFIKCYGEGAETDQN